MVSTFRSLFVVLATTLFFASPARAADVTGFRHAHFGDDEKAVVVAATADLNVKANDINRSTDPITRVNLITVNLKSFDPLDLPATVTYVMGYQCKCLTQVGIVWSMPENISVAQRKTAMTAIGALVGHFEGENWGKDETITNHVAGEVKDGSENILIFFRGQNKKGETVALAGAPVKMVKNDKGGKDDKKDNQLAADIDNLKKISLTYEKDAANPDIYRVNVTGF